MENLETDIREDRGTFRERAPSILREDEPSFARIVGIAGLTVALFGVMAIAVTAAGKKGPFGFGWGSFFLASGIAGLLFHAAADKDLQVRRSYSLLGILLLVGGIVLSVMQWYAVAKPETSGAELTPQQQMGGLFLLGFVCFVFALLFLLASLRHETDDSWRNRLVAVVGGAGAVAALTGFIGSNIRQGEFLYPYGVLLALTGAFYLWAFVGLKGSDGDFGYRTGQAIGVLGAVVFLTAFIRSLFPSYLVPTGFILMCLGLLYLASSVAICSDRPVVVLTRRELTAFFYSPIAYIVLLGLTCVAWAYFYLFLMRIILETQQRIPVIEPIVRHYISDVFPIIMMIFVVPVLSMRLLSEEKRTASLEVLLTAPVNETAVVISKFVAALAFLLLAWLPWCLFLVALRIENAKAFDFRPVLSLMLAMTFMGAGFMGMGLFFSSLTRSQIASAVLTFLGMMFLTALAVINYYLKSSPTPTQAHWVAVLTHTSYLELWFDSVEGKLNPRYLIFHLSFAVLWLFMTIKVLESRRWS
jgi:ABC-2 type transport system permease protein